MLLKWLILLCLPPLALADQKWQVTSRGGQFAASSPAHAGLSIALQSVGGTPKGLRWEALKERAPIAVLYYVAGEAGTSAIYRIERGAIVNLSTKTILGDAPWRYERVGGPKGDLEQPIWQWKVKSLSVTDPEKGEDLLLTWK